MFFFKKFIKKKNVIFLLYMPKEIITKGIDIPKEPVLFLKQLVKHIFDKYGYDVLSAAFLEGSLFYCSVNLNDFCEKGKTLDEYVEKLDKDIENISAFDTKKHNIFNDVLRRMKGYASTFDDIDAFNEECSIALLKTQQARFWYHEQLLTNIDVDFSDIVDYWFKID